LCLDLAADDQISGLATLKKTTAMSVQKAAIRLGAAPYEVLAAIKRGDLPATKFGGRWTITEAALARYRDSDAEIARQAALANAYQRRREEARILHENQRAAEIEARTAEAAINNLVAEAMLAFARLSAAVRRAHSVEDDGRRA
jgi:hypothetical protein